jgi:hypothetical protein
MVEVEHSAGTLAIGDVRRGTVDVGREAAPFAIVSDREHLGGVG